jgi:imidazolonepropionase-like amidohydrolase
MITFIRVLGLVTCIGVFASETELPAQENPQGGALLALTDITVIDVVTGELLPGMSLVVRGGRIAGLGPTGDVAIPGNALRPDVRGKFVIPGLWDMHVHLFNNTSGSGTNNADRYFPMFIANGVTGVRDMWTDLEDLREVRRWREERASGELVGPRIVPTSTILDGPEPSYRNMLVIATAREARRVVDSLAAGGAEFIKVYRKLPREVYLAIAERARESGISFGGHISQGVRAAEASDAGQKSMEHLLNLREMCMPDPRQFVAEYRRRARLDYPEASLRAAAWARDETRKSYGSDYCAAVLEKFRENRTWQVPTLVLTRARDVLLNDSAVLNDSRLEYVPAAVRQRWARDTEGGGGGWQLFRTYSRLVPVLHSHGVPILVGTDLGNWYIYAGFSVHDEMQLLVEEGRLSPLTVLQAATLNPATYLGARDSLGTVDVGKIADLVILDANPLQDIENTRRIHAVVLGGEFLNRQGLDQMLLKVTQLVRN